MATRLNRAYAVGIQSGMAVNSSDAMPDGGVLEIEVRGVEDAAVFEREMFGPAVLLTVADTGSGMDGAVLERAFEPFFTTKEAGLGTGLGLATVYGIVRQSNGQIWAESAPGRGTKVWMLFPRIEAEAEPVDVPLTRLPEIEGGESILVVEDDPAVRALAVAALERAGFCVMAVSSPAQAVALTDGLDETIDLLLTDLVMPGGNGRDLAERLMASRPKLRVVLISGYDSPPPESGPEDRFLFLAKPFGAAELAAVVRTALAEPPR